MVCFPPKNREYGQSPPKIEGPPPLRMFLTLSLSNQSLPKIGHLIGLQSKNICLALAKFGPMLCPFLVLILWKPLCLKYILEGQTLLIKYPC